MFDNIGNKIKTLASVICWIFIILFGLGGVILAFTLDKFLFLILAAVGCLLAWVGSFILYGFGQLIEDTSSIRSYLHSASRTPQRGYYPQPGATGSAAQVQAASRAAAPTQNNPQQSVQPSEVLKVRPVSAGENLIKCTECGSVQKIDRKTCYRCGAVFIE